MRWFFCSHIFPLNFLRWVTLLHFSPKFLWRFFFGSHVSPLGFLRRGILLHVFLWMFVRWILLHSHIFPLDFLRWFVRGELFYSRSFLHIVLRQASFLFFFFQCFAEMHWAKFFGMEQGTTLKISLGRILTTRLKTKSGLIVLKKNWLKLLRLFDEIT